MTTTIFEITNCDDEQAELYLRAALESVQFLSNSLVISDISAESHDATRGIIAEVTTNEQFSKEHLDAVKALIHVQCPANKSIKMKHIVTHN